jgi:DNA topoisomerase-1
MADSKYLQTTIILDNNDYKFKSSGSVVIFDGFLKTYQDNEEDDNKLPNLKGVDEITSNEILSDQHFTKAPARYSESSLIKELESLGIGRPSTYATIIDTLKSRDYVVLEDKKFVPTAIGFETTDKLQEFFSNIINVEYTANMEKDLDDIAENKKDNIKVLRDFWNIFEDEVEDAFSNMEKKKAEETGEVCPECGSPLVKRNGRYGEFVACSNYPSCKYIKKEEKEVKEICDCPKCGGKIIEKTTRKGKVFFGCSNYPKCKVATWDLPNGEVCPECGELLVVKKEGIKCSSCDYEK